MEIDLTRGFKLNGESLLDSGIYTADGLVQLNMLVPGGTVNQLAQIAVNRSLTQIVYILSSQAVTINTNGVNAVQTVTIGGGPTGGTITLSYGGQTTAPIAYNATAATVQAALAALTSINGLANVGVTGSPGGPYTVTFLGTLGIQPITTMTGSAAGLTGGTPTLTIASATTGVAPDQSLPFAANNALSWAKADGYFTNPITTNLNQISVTNPGTTLAKLQLRFGVNAS